ncbi:MAG TPA: NupC/NupG family nucleoside CNT transporter [Deltaproteobacteria bacterium]|nr:NupC/NupG family nucleoside CNT transporter [Deltaproteobacteria bacterium]
MITAEKIVSLAGVGVFVGVAWLFSEDRRRIDWRLVAWGIGLQAAAAVAVLKTAPGRMVFDGARAAMTGLLDFTAVGAGFLFGKLVDDFSIGAVVAFKVLPTIIFVSSLMGVLYYLRVIQALVWLMARIMERTMRASGTEAFMAAMFVFMGIEAVTAVKDYVARMTRSELFTLMTGFMSTIAGSVMAAYVSFGASAGHLLAASVMSAPAAVVISKLMVPERLERPADGPSVTQLRSDDINIIEAAANGAAAGLNLAATIGAMLLAFIAIIGMLDAGLGSLGISFEAILGYLFAPAAFVMGVPPADCLEVGKLLGIKVVFNEFISYQKLQAHITAGTLSERSITIATYGLCSFANFGSIAILMGGIGAVAPSRKKEVAALALRALAAGTMAGFMTATIAGVLV